MYEKWSTTKIIIQINLKVPLSYDTNLYILTKENTLFIKILREEICVKRNKKLFYRAWDFSGLHANPEFFKETMKDVEPHNNLYISIKHTLRDFDQSSRLLWYLQKIWSAAISYTVDIRHSWIIDSIVQACNNAVKSYYQWYGLYLQSEDLSEVSFVVTCGELKARRYGSGTKLCSKLCHQCRSN